MEQLSQLVVAFAMVTILFGTGLGLTVDSFRNVARHPAIFLVGAFVQIVLLPLAAVAIGYALGAGPTLTAGLALIAASPCNASSPLFARLARADVALATALLGGTTLLSALTVPAVLSLTTFFGSDFATAMKFSAVRIALALFMLTTLPTAAGMLVRRFGPLGAKRLERRFPVWGTIVLLVMIAVVLYGEWDHLEDSVARAGVAVVVLNVVAILTGLTVPTLLGASSGQRTAIATTCGLRNCGVAAMIALTLLNDAALLLPAFAYAAFMWITAGGTSLYFSRCNTIPSVEVSCSTE